MVKFSLKVHPKQRTMYMPQELVQIIGNEPDALPNAFSILLFKKDENIGKVLKSLDIIKQDLELRLESEEKEI